MLCDACKKHEATVHLTQIGEDGNMQTYDLCESCSKAKGIEDPTGFSLAGLLMGLGSQKESETIASEPESKCPECGFSLADFKKAGRFGCPQCYAAFSDPLNSLLKSMHKGIKHTGKRPQSQAKNLAVVDQLQQLQAQLEEAIQTENFEQAAVLRDQIKQLKS